MFRCALLLLPAWIAAAAPAPASPLSGTALPVAAPAPYAQPSVPTVQGLRGDYYNGRNFEQKVLSRVDQRLQFHWQPGERVGPGIEQKAFSVRWTGKLYAPVEGIYNFIINTDNGVRLWVDGRLLISSWDVYTLATFKKEIKLAGDRYYDLKIEYNNYMGPAIFRLAWESPVEGTATSGLPHYTPEDVIPAKYLFTEPPPNQPAVATAADVAVSRTGHPGGGNGLLGEYFRATISAKKSSPGSTARSTSAGKAAPARTFTKPTFRCAGRASCWPPPTASTIYGKRQRRGPPVGRGQAGAR
jgi:hypothetical protein